MSGAREDVLQRVLRSPRLPSLPSIAVEVLSLAQKQDADIQQIARTIQHDPALSGKILKTVNSAFYGCSQSISTISHALVVLGLNSVKALALGFSLVGDLTASRAKGLDYVAYWRRCLYTATAARTLSQHAGIVQNEEAFLGGLLQDVGMVAMSQALGEEYGELLRKSGSDHSSLRRYEMEQLGIDHAAVGAALAEGWQLPPLLVAPIRYHEDPEAYQGCPDETERDLLALVRSVALGNRVADIFLSEGSGGDELDTCHKLAEEWFGLRHDQTDPLLKQFHEQTHQMGQLFEVPTGDLGDPDEILARANEALAVITIQAQQQTSELQHQNERLTSQAQTDALTGSLNRRAFDQYVEEQFQAADPSRPVSLMFIDVDKLKKFNDTHGHAVGDRVLTACAETLRGAVGEQGRVYRYGGEEFTVVCPDTDHPTAARIAEQARQAVEDHARVHDDHGQELSITCSVGVATHTGDTFECAAGFIKAADQGVYAAKAAGRNCVRGTTADPRESERVAVLVDSASNRVSARPQHTNPPGHVN